MPKHRGAVYAVVRNSVPTPADAVVHEMDSRLRPVLIGVYASMSRAEEVVGASAQTLKDLGVTGFTFEVQPTTWYDE